MAPMPTSPTYETSTPPTVLIFGGSLSWWMTFLDRQICVSWAFLTEKLLLSLGKSLFDLFFLGFPFSICWVKLFEVIFKRFPAYFQRDVAAGCFDCAPSPVGFVT